MMMKTGFAGEGGFKVGAEAVIGAGV